MPSKSKAAPLKGVRLSAQISRAASKPKRVYKTRPIVARPDPLWIEWEDPGDFAAALDLHVRRHGETIYALHKALAVSGDKIDVQTLYTWQRREKEPRSTSTFRILTAIEARYRLPEGYFRAKLTHPSRMVTGGGLEKLSTAERRRIAWHLPDDFDRLPKAKRDEILEWVRTVVVSGSTEYRRYHANAQLYRFSFRFSEGNRPLPMPRPAALADRLADGGEIVIGRPRGAERAPPVLDAEARDLRLFKTATLTNQRQGPKRRLERGDGRSEDGSPRADVRRPGGMSRGRFARLWRAASLPDLRDAALPARLGLVLALARDQARFLHAVGKRDADRHRRPHTQGHGLASAITASSQLSAPY
ncbi:hypothetical protein V7S57_16755 [Caulobacter sp. CCNWLY153]|uniref:hypothetical protein n=1 Tax=Caulobacter sp. CCNWLY153 TaxID=3125794 RepID=UPI0030146790